MISLVMEFRSVKEQVGGNVPEIHCSRQRSRAAWQIIEDYLTPFVERERYQIPKNCRLHPDNDLYRDQEQHKIHVDLFEWKCGYCKKSFSEEKFLDQHFNTRHYNLLNTTDSKCLADLCGALHCDFVLSSKKSKSKCNPAAVARNRHLCESVANSCFPVSQGPSASRLHEHFLRQFCDAHTCTGSNKPFPRGGKSMLIRAEELGCLLPCHINTDLDATPALLSAGLLTPKVSFKLLMREQGVFKPDIGSLNHRSSTLLLLLRAFLKPDTLWIPKIVLLWGFEASFYGYQIFRWVSKDK
ncbi:unnamed protein product [Arabis nemorensis]|uniref:C2H2-type domain-containing protein n=1 Tax=Arabis nemorensis TaxID=586526 RepID=A0A565CWB8_9BRAS|nr:unnamed protein product [Arabis nemorensis]